MASSKVVAAVGSSIERLLTQALASEPQTDGRTALARLVRTEDFGRATQPTPLVSVFLYRVELNRTTRARWAATAAADGRAHLPLDLYFLFTAWAESPQHEYELLGRVVQCLEETPILSGPLLATDGWEPNDAVQLVIDDMSTDTVMRIFDSLQANYKLSIPYIARAIRLDGRSANLARPAVQVAIEDRPGIPT